MFCDRARRKCFRGIFSDRNCGRTFAAANCGGRNVARNIPTEKNCGEAGEGACDSRSHRPPHPARILLPAMLAHLSHRGRGEEFCACAIARIVLKGAGRACIPLRASRKCEGMERRKAHPTNSTIGARLLSRADACRGTRRTLTARTPLGAPSRRFCASGPYFRARTGGIRPDPAGFRSAFVRSASSH
jgi:hypothetical protein